EQDHRRDTSHAKVHRRVLILVDVQLDDLELTGLLGSDLLEHGCHHATRTAPFGPEVDQNGCLALDFCLERGIGYMSELSHCGRSPSCRPRRRPDSLLRQLETRAVDLRGRTLLPRDLFPNLAGPVPRPFSLEDADY